MNKIEICNRNFKFLLFGIDSNLSNSSYQNIAILSDFDNKLINLSRYTFVEESTMLDQSETCNIKFI